MATILAQPGLMPTHSPLPVNLVKGEGLWLWDKEGRRYLDTFSGLAVLPLGHSHPAILSTIHKQSSKLMHTSNALGHELNEQLAIRLFELTGLPRAFFCSSGAEANEAAIKLVRLYGHSKGINNPKILVFDQSYHGRTLATLSATGFGWAHKGFEPLVTGFVRASYDDIPSVKHCLETHKDIVAIMLEPILGAGGVVIPDDRFLPELRALCDAHNLLLVCDEVQCGLGRVGHFLQSQALSVQPDIVTLAKGLAGGYPIGACLATSDIAALFTPGSHGSTFGGNPLACACALAFLETLSSNALLEKNLKHGNQLLSQLRISLENNPLVEHIDGRGLMVGIKINMPSAKKLVQEAANNGLLINVANQSTIRLLPAYVVTETEITTMVQQLKSLLTNC